MINWGQFIFIFLLSLLLSFLFSYLIIFLAKKIKLVDQAGVLDRKIHTNNIPLGGGLAIFITWILVAGLLWQQGIIPDQRFDIDLLLWVGLSSLILMLNGILDDKYAWSAKITILGPLVAIIMVLLAGLRINYITSPLGGIWYLNHLWVGISIILTFLWLLGMTYTTKLLDGMDGLAASISLIAALAIFIVSLSWDIKGATTSYLSIILVGAIFGFLLWNWHPAKIFLGEAGSTWLGFILAVLAVISGSKIATALLVMGLPVLDIVIVIIRRIKKGQSIWQGDQEHLHFRLLNQSWSQRQVVLFFCVVSLLFGITAIFANTVIKITALVILVLFVLIFSYFLDKIIKNKNHALK